MAETVEIIYTEDKGMYPIKKSLFSSNAIKNQHFFFFLKLKRSARDAIAKYVLLTL